MVQLLTKVPKFDETSNRLGKKRRSVYLGSTSGAQGAPLGSPGLLARLGNPSRRSPGDPSQTAILLYWTAHYARESSMELHFCSTGLLARLNEFPSERLPTSSLGVGYTFVTLSCVLGRRTRSLYIEELIPSKKLYIKTCSESLRFGAGLRTPGPLGLKKTPLGKHKKR